MDWFEFARLVVTLIFFPKIMVKEQLEVKGLFIALLDLAKEVE